MLKKFSFYVAILWLSVLTQSVEANTCSDQTVRIESAADINAFAARSCTVLTGQLIITGLTESVSLSPISGLQEIGGGLYIYNNTGGPSSLAGFDDLRSVGGLINLSNNSSLTDVSALSNLVSVGGNLYISRNPNLAVIDGLGAVAQIDGTFTVEGPVEEITSMPSLTYVEYGIKIEDTKLINLDWLVGLAKINNNLNIRNNIDLESVSGLNNLSEITGSLLVSGNSSLKTLYGLDGLNIVGGQVSNNGIVNVVVNRSLSDCTSLRGVLGYPDSNDSVAGSIQLSDNLTGCNSQEQVFAGHVTIDIQIEGAGRSNPPDQISVPFGEGASIDLFPTSGFVEIKPETTCPGSLQDLMFTVTEATTDCRLNLKFLSQQAADVDSDGIPDSQDNCSEVPNSNQTDTDSDGLGDACDDDDDGDGTPDEFDEVPLDSSETEDSDSDGVGDNSDNCPAIANEDQLDTDSDGDGDLCDDDDDGDGVSDVDDAFPLDGTEVSDTDGDGIGDNSDLYPTDPTNDPDSDEDGIEGPEDNCPSDYNPYQLDRDDDGIGDACDIEVLSPGQISSGQIKTTFSTEAHIYGVDLTTAADLEVTVKGLDYLDGITYEIRDEQGNILGGNDFSVFETSGGETDTRNISVTSAGTYLITITGDYQTNYEVSYKSSEPSGTYEIEPNSLLSNATQIPVGGTRVGHFWPEDSDVDIYYLLSTTPTKLKFTMTATGSYSPFSAEILDANGSLIGEVDFNFPDNGVGLVSLAASERTYIRLINFNQREEYTVSISLADTDEDGVPDDTDNCSSIYNPNQDDFDSDGAGDLCDTDDDNDGVADAEDAFPLDATEDTDTDSDGVGNNADLDDDNDGLSDEVEAEYGTDPLSASDYPVTLETEDNSDIETADAFTAGIPMVGSLYSHEDVDIFKFSVDAAVDLTIDIRKSSDSDSIRYIVVDSDPNLLAGGRLAFPRSETRTVGILESGTYFVAVGGNGLLDTSTDEYEIRLTAAPFSGSFEVEPNNNDLMAKGLSNGVPIYGHLANEDDVDVFTFEVTWPATLEFQIDKLTNYSDRIKYLVRDEAGATLAGGDLFGSEAVTKRIGLEGVGSYYIEIYNNDLLSVSLEEYGILASWTEPPDTDSDGDGVTDSEDNCPNQSNVSQSDYDGDGAGDSCDSDDDNDTVPDLQDAFPLDSSESTDTDGDGVGNNADTDDDGDGYSDSEEALAGTDPLDGASYPESAGDERSGLPIWLYYIATQREATL